MLAGVTGSSVELCCEKVVANVAAVHISAKVCASVVCISVSQYVPQKMSFSIENVHHLYNSVSSTMVHWCTVMSRRKCRMCVAQIKEVVFFLLDVYTLHLCVTCW